MNKETSDKQTSLFNHPNQGVQVAGNVTTGGGDFIGRDKNVGGDEVRSDKSRGTSISNISNGIHDTIIAGRDVTNISVAIEKKSTLADPSITYLHLPPKVYRYLIGRFNELDQLMTILRDGERKSIIAIVGLGGTGKTALAREVTERCLQENLFDHVIWVSFKVEYFIGENILKKDIANNYSFDELLNDISRQYNKPDIVRLPLEQKQNAIKFLLAAKPALIVMDNLETIPDAEKLLDTIFQILGKSKLLITSRHSIKNEYVFNLKLGGFPEDEGVIFLKENSKERGIEAIAQARYPQLIEIYQASGGAPLAMKLVIGQMSRQPMNVVLNTLKQAAFKGQDYPFYRFVYQYSWDILDIDARMALVDMSVFPPTIGGTMTDVQAISQVKPGAFWQAMDQLVTLSLVDKIGLAGQERYALHPLTQYFIRSDITKEWINQ